MKRLLLFLLILLLPSLCFGQTWANGFSPVNIAPLATSFQTIQGTSTITAVTPSGLQSKIDTDGTLAGDLDTRIASQKATKTYSDTKQPAGDYQPSFNASQAVNWANGATQEITLTASITTLTFSNWVNGQSYRLILIQGGSGSYTVAWPPGIKWMSGSAPTLTTTTGHADVITFVYGNSVIYGAATLNFS